MFENRDFNDLYKESITVTFHTLGTPLSLRTKILHQLAVLQEEIEAHHDAMLRARYEA